MHSYVHYRDNPKFEKLTVFETHEMHAGNFMQFAQSAHLHDLAERRIAQTSIQTRVWTGNSEN